LTELAKNKPVELARPKAMSNAVSSGLVLCQNVLKTKEPTTKDGRMAWVSLMKEAGIEEHEILPSFKRFMLTEKFFPAPCEIIKIAYQLRREDFDRREEQQERERVEELEAQRRLEQEAWDSLSDEEKERRKAESKAFREKVKAEALANMAEFDRLNPNRSCPGFMSMVAAVEVLK